MGKPPAFPMYAADFDMDTAAWTATQVGVYMRLLFHEWVNGSLPIDMARLSRIARVDVRSFAKMWTPVIAKKFTTNDAGMYVNNRMELERQKIAKYREVQSQKGVVGNQIKWKDHIAGAIPVRSPEDRFSSSYSFSNTIKRNIVRPDKSGTHKSAPIDFISELKKLDCYQGIDIDNELSKMDAWLLTPKGKGRTKTKRFIVNWLNKIDKPMQISTTKAPSPKRICTKCGTQEGQVSAQVVGKDGLLCLDCYKELTGK